MVNPICKLYEYMARANVHPNTYKHAETSARQYLRQYFTRPPYCVTCMFGCEIVQLWRHARPAADAKNTITHTPLHTYILNIITSTAECMNARGAIIYRLCVVYNSHGGSSNDCNFIRTEHAAHTHNFVPPPARTIHRIFKISALGM